MSLQPGTTLGPYEIVAPLGAGGMGEVFRARDTRLDRTVAVKILPKQFAATPAMRARFDREARAISAITHPNICALYDVGHFDGIDYLVMEYLEGETLWSRLSRGRLPISQVLRYGAEIAQALHHAHRRGITHRDLKPGNVMITASGAKLLDFGLAKLAVSPSDISAASQVDTRIEPLTTEGTIIGTVPYMSPEQVEGRELDPRSDLFSLGVMLYEMATGRRPFSGNSSPALIASILTTDPPPDASIPPALDRVIRTALEKNPDDRWQSAHDLARELRWLADSSSMSTQHILSPRKARRVPLIAAFALAVIAAAALGWFVARRMSPASPAAMRLSFALPSGVAPAIHPEEKWLAISPDGTRVVFAGANGNETALYIRALDSVDAQKLEGTDGAGSPFFSPDGKWIGYEAKEKLWKLRLSGGTPEPLCDVRGATASWQGDTILFANGPGGVQSEILRVSASGGRPEPVTKLNQADHEVRHTFPYLLSDQKHFLYIAGTDRFEHCLMLGSLDSPQRRRLTCEVSGAVASRDQLYYVRGGTLYAQPFDAGSGLHGDPVAVAEHVFYFLPSSRANFDVSQNGVVTYATNTATGRLLLRNRAGAETRVLESEGSFYHLGVSPDGKQAAVSVSTRATGMLDIWTYDLARGVRVPFAAEALVETDPIWSPDGRTIAYSSARGAPPRLMLRRLSAAAATPIDSPGTFQIAGSFSPDGTWLYYHARDLRRILRVALDGSHRVEVVIDAHTAVADPQISPDGKWIAFISRAAGTPEVYVQNLESGDRVRVSNHGGEFPRWRGDGNELVYVAGQSIVSATPRTQGRWDDPAVTELFRVGAEVEGFDVLPDGQQFLLGETTSAPQDSLIHIAK